MTDHSILSHGLPELPFHREARLITRFIAFFGTKVPTVIANAITANSIYETVNGFNDEQLTALGIDRTGVAIYAAEKAGLLDR